jgi:Ca2+-binding RTX toxin-like protein
VSGTDAAEEITISQGRRKGPIQIVYQSSGQLTVTSQQDVPGRSVKRILVEARGGNDKVTLRGNLAPATVLGGGGNDKIDAYSNQVTLNGGAGRDRIRHLVDPISSQAFSYLRRTYVTSIGHNGSGTTIADLAKAADDGTPGPRGIVFQDDATGGTQTFTLDDTAEADVRVVTVAYSASSLIIGGDGDDSLVTEYDSDQLDGGRGVDAAYFSGSGSATFINGQRPTTLRYTWGTLDNSFTSNVYVQNTESSREID